MGMFDDFIKVTNEAHKNIDEMNRQITEVKNATKQIYQDRYEPVKKFFDEVADMLSNMHHKYYADKLMEVPLDYYPNKDNVLRFTIGVSQENCYKPFYSVIRIQRPYYLPGDRDIIPFEYDNYENSKRDWDYSKIKAIDCGPEVAGYRINCQKAWEQIINNWEKIEPLFENAIKDMITKSTADILRESEENYQDSKATLEGEMSRKERM